MNGLPYDRTGAENVEEAIVSLMDKTGRIYEELASDALFYIDRKHNKEYGEPLTDANYTTEVSEMNNDWIDSYLPGHVDKSEVIGHEWLGSSSEEISAKFQTMLEDGAYESKRFKRAKGFGDKDYGKILAELPEYVSTNPGVERFVDQIWQEDFKPVFEDESDSLHSWIRQWMYEQEDFPTELGEPLEP